MMSAMTGLHTPTADANNTEKLGRIPPGQAPTDERHCRGHTPKTWAHTAEPGTNGRTSLLGVTPPAALARVDVGAAAGAGL